MEEPLGRLEHLSAVLYRPLERLTGRVSHRRSSLTLHQIERQEHLPPLPPPWDEDDRWYRGGFPPRAHNHLQPLPHGAEYFPDLCEHLAQARERVTIAGWCLTPLMDLARGSDIERSIVAEILHDTSQHAEVYVLLWAGAPGLFEPTVHMVREVRDTLKRIAPRVRCTLDTRAHFSHDHHQKAVTIDGRVAYVGGIDLSTFQGDRYDTAQHPLRFGPNWHDVQVRLQGEVVEDVERNFCQRWNACTGEALQPLPAPPPDPTWNTPAQVVRTVPAEFYPFAPHGEYGIRHALLAGIQAAKHFIYMENQYLWAPEIVEALCEAMDRQHDGPFRIVVVLPAKAYTGKYDNDEHVRALRERDNGRGMFEAYSIYASGPATGKTGYEYVPIYVHAKVTIIDDQWFCVGSANLNRRGLATDTEICVQAVAPEIARNLRVQLWAEHLGMAEAEVAAADPCSLIDDEWKSASRRVAEAVRTRGLPPGPQAFRYQPGTNPGSRMLDLVQGMTLEH